MQFLIQYPIIQYTLLQFSVRTHTPLQHSVPVSPLGVRLPHPHLHRRGEVVLGGHAGEVRGQHRAVRAVVNLDTGPLDIYTRISTDIYTDLLESPLHVQLDLGAVCPHQHVLAQPVEGVGLVVEGVDVRVSEHRGCNITQHRYITVMTYLQ